MKKILSFILTMALFCATGMAQEGGVASPTHLLGKKAAKAPMPKSVITSGDTLSYCGNIEYQYNVGYPNSSDNYHAYWGIMIPAENLTGHNYLKSVMLYIDATGTYTMNIYSGGTSAPNTLIHTQTNSFFTSYQRGWNEIFLDTICPIPNDNLWVTFESYGITYPASASYYCGDANSDWITNNLDVSSWVHAISGSDCTWMIKAVTSETAPTPSAPIVNLYGPSKVPVGDTAWFFFTSPNSTSMTWNINATYSYTNVDTAKAMWNTTGIKQVIATATNSYGSTTDTLEVEVIDCSISTFPHTWDFEDASEIACWKLGRQSGGGWYYYNFPNNSFTFDGGAGFIYSLSDGSETTSYAISPAIQLPSGENAWLIWDDYANGSNQSYAVYVSTSGTNISDFTLVSTYYIYSYSGWGHRMLNLSAYAGQTIHIAFCHYNEYTGNLFIDNVTVKAGKQINLLCSGNGSGSIYRTGDYLRGLCGSTDIVATGTLASYDFIPDDGNNLTHLYVNGVDRISSMTGSTYSLTVTQDTTIEAVFMYDCNVSSFPYRMGFNGSEHFSDCWITTIYHDTIINVNGYSELVGGWYMGYNDYSGYGNALQSISSYWYYDYSSDNYASIPVHPDNWAISPAMHLPAGNGVYLSWLALAYDDYDYSTVTTPNETYRVYVSTTGTDTANFTLLGEYTLTSYGQEINLDLSAYAGQTVRIAFRHISGNDRLSLDNILVEVGNLVTFTCSGNGEGEVWAYVDGSYREYLCGTSEFIQNGSQIDLYFSPIECDLTHLYVNDTDRIADVADNHYSFTVSGTMNVGLVFEFECDVNTFPYTMGFEATNIYEQCWSKLCFHDTSYYNTATGDLINIGNWNRVNYNYYSHSGDYCLYSMSSLYTYDEDYNYTFTPFDVDNWIISPSIQIPSGTGAYLKWYTNIDDYDTYDYFGLTPSETYSVYVSTTGTDTANFTRLGEYTLTSYGWQEMTLDLSAYAGQTIHIAFRHTGGTLELWLDDIKVETGHVVSVNCTGRGSGYTFYTNNYTGDLCGTSEILPQGFLASYDFIPTDGHLDHLYVNNVDRINDVVTHSSGSSASYYTYSFTVTGSTTVNPVFNYDFYPVSFNCEGDGSGAVYNSYGLTVDNLCGEIDSVRQGFLASYSFIPSRGNDMTHLYVNNVDRISDAYSESYGTYSSTHYYSYEFEVNAATTVRPVFTRIPYTITATSADPTRGMVTGGGSYFYDSTVTLTATPMPHYEFLYWGIIREGDTIIIDNEELEEEGFNINPLQFPVQRDMSLVAFFGPESYTVTVAPNNVLFGSVEGGGTFEYLQPVTVSANAYSGYHFQMWSNGSTYNPYTFPASENLDLVAIFIADGDSTQYFAVTTAVNDPTMGSVTGGGVFTMGATTTLTATANSGYHFVQWQDGNTSNPRTITVTANAEYTAYFAEDQGITYTLTVLSANDEMGSVSGGGVYSPGEEATLTAIPNEGFRFAQWQDGDTTNPRIIVVDADATYIATFASLNGIVNATDDGTRVYSYADRIYVAGAAGRTVKVFDISGRLMTRVDRVADAVVFDMHATGVYIVTVGNDKAYRVIVR